MILAHNFQPPIYFTTGICMLCVSQTMNEKKNATEIGMLCLVSRPQIKLESVVNGQPKGNYSLIEMQMSKHKQKLSLPSAICLL